MCLPSGPGSLSHSSDRFFQGVTDGTLITDRYSAYKALVTNIKKAFCWAHVRHDFIKVRDGYPKLAALGQRMDRGITSDKLFAANADRTRRIVPGEQTDEQIFASKYLVTFLVKQIEERMDAELKTKKLHNQLLIRLESTGMDWQSSSMNPLIPMDNNGAEELFRNPVMGRKATTEAA